MTAKYKRYRELESGDNTALYKVLGRVYREDEGYVKLLVLWNDCRNQDQELTFYEPNQFVQVMS